MRRVAKDISLLATHGTQNGKGVRKAVSGEKFRPSEADA
jgi:hypothetical protein